MKKKLWEGILFFILACIVAIVSWVVLSERIEKRKVHIDEPGWITSSLYYTDLLLEHDFSLDKWLGSNLYGFSGKYYSHVGQWLMGLPLRVLYDGPGQNFFGFYAPHKSQKDNRNLGKLPPWSLLFSARYISAVFGVLNCLMVLLIGYHVGSVGVGLVAAMLVATAPLFIRHGALALTDMYYVFFLLNSCLAILLFAKSYQRRFLVLAGIFCGLATSVKIVGLPVLVFMLLIYFVLGVIQRKMKPIACLLGMVIFLLSAFLLVYVVNPYFWGKNFFIKFFLMALDLDLFFQKVILEGHARWGESRFWTLHVQLFSVQQNFPFEGIAVILGFLWMGFRIFRKKEGALYSVLIAFFISNYLFILMFMRVNWERYYLPTVIACQFLTAYCIVEGWAWFWNFLRERCELRMARVDG